MHTLVTQWEIYDNWCLRKCTAYCDFNIEVLHVLVTSSTGDIGKVTTHQKECNRLGKHQPLLSVCSKVFGTLQNFESLLTNSNLHFFLVIINESSCLTYYLIGNWEWLSVKAYNICYAHPHAMQTNDAVRYHDTVRQGASCILTTITQPWNLSQRPRRKLYADNHHHSTMRTQSKTAVY